MGILPRLPVEIRSAHPRMQSGYLLHRGFQPIQDGKLEFCAFVLSGIHTKYIFVAFHISSDHNRNSTFYNTPFITHMIVNSIQKNNCVDFLQGPFLPFFYNGKDLSVILLMVLAEISISYSSRIWLSISFVVIPFAYMEMIFSSMS